MRRHKELQNELFKLYNYETGGEMGREYYDGDRIAGEIDYERDVGDKHEFYEVKSSTSYLSKGKKQLKRAEEYHPEFKCKKILMYIDGLGEERFRLIE
jgi:hypothetical protein